MTTVHPPPPAAKSYRDAAMCRASSAIGSSLPSTASPDIVLEPQLSSAQVERLQEQFPHQVTISTEKFAASTRAWSNALIGKCLGREVHADKMSSALSSQWSSLGEWELFPLINGFYVFRFSSPEARDEVLLGGPWVVEGAVLALSQFDPGFRSTTDHVLRAVLWVRLPELPPGFWSDAIITDILMVVGRVVRLDDHTRLRTRGRFARAAVEVDLRQPLLPGVTVGVESAAIKPFWQVFQYENVHNFCVRCRRVGHKGPSCSFKSTSPIATADSGDTVAASVVDAASSADTSVLPMTWAASLMVRRHHRPSTIGDGAGHRPREKAARARISKQSPPPHPQVSSKQAATSSLHVGDGDMGSLHVGDGDMGTDLGVSAPASPLPASSSGPLVQFGPATGSLGPSFFTLATGPKHSELINSTPAPKAVYGPFVGGGSGGNAMTRVSVEEDRMIHEILLENATDNDDDDLGFTIAGKKKKQSKGKMKEICLRLEPRNRALKKKGKFGGSHGNFALLHDLVGDATLQELLDRHGPPPDGMV